MADLSIPWKKLQGGLPKAKNYSDDRIPTIEEIMSLANRMGTAWPVKQV